MHPTFYLGYYQTNSPIVTVDYKVNHPAESDEIRISQKEASQSAQSDVNKYHQLVLPSLSSHLTAICAFFGPML